MLSSTKPGTLQTRPQAIQEQPTVPLYRPQLLQHQPFSLLLILPLVVQLVLPWAWYILGLCTAISIDKLLVIKEPAFHVAKKNHFAKDCLTAAKINKISLTQKDNTKSKKKEL